MLGWEGGVWDGGLVGIGGGEEGGCSVGRNASLTGWL